MLAYLVIERRSRIALIVASVLFLLDSLAVLASVLSGGGGVGGILMRGFVMMHLWRAFNAMKPAETSPSKP